MGSFGDLVGLKGDDVFALLQSSGHSHATWARLPAGSAMLPWWKTSENYPQYSPIIQDPPGPFLPFILVPGPKMAPRERNVERKSLLAVQMQPQELPWPPLPATLLHLDLLPRCEMTALP
jgi:hypothetical protein